MWFPNLHTNSWKFFVGFVLLVVVCECDAYQKDLVKNLPGQPPVSFKQYAGYVTVDIKHGRSLFYYFVEAQYNSTSKPLVIWLNGGPGCSSVGVGAFSENGPFQPTGNILVHNQHSWNKAANILYLETPAGVGFSYSNDATYYRDVDDASTAKDNVSFLRRWFKKFPRYKGRDLFITGESYAGHYIPQWADSLTRVNSNHKKPLFNLKGVALGNPLLNFQSDFNARAEYLWSHGLISDKAFTKMSKDCNYGQYVHEYYSHNLSSLCQSVNNMVDNEVSDYVSSYDVTLDVCLGPQSRALTIKSRFLSSSMETQKSYKFPDVCLEDESKNYLNREEVQRALNIPIKIDWDTCSSIIHYNHQNLEIETVPLLARLVRAGVRVFVYSGDQDSVIPLTSTRTLINKLARSLGLKSSSSYRVWFEGDQVGGWTQEYGSGREVTYATVRGASHEVPFSQPQRSLVLFKSFLAGQSLPRSS